MAISELEPLQKEITRMFQELKKPDTAAELVKYCEQKLVEFSIELAGKEFDESHKGFMEDQFALSFCDALKTLPKVVPVLVGPLLDVALLLVRTNLLPIRIKSQFYKAITEFAKSNEFESEAGGQCTLTLKYFLKNVCTSLTRDLQEIEAARRKNEIMECLLKWTGKKEIAEQIFQDGSLADVIHEFLSWLSKKLERGAPTRNRKWTPELLAAVACALKVTQKDVDVDAAMVISKAAISGCAKEVFIESGAEDALHDKVMDLYNSRDSVTKRQLIMEAVINTIYVSHMHHLTKLHPKSPTELMEAWNWLMKGNDEWLAAMAIFLATEQQRLETSEQEASIINNARAAQNIVKEAIQFFKSEQPILRFLGLRRLYCFLAHFEGPTALHLFECVEENARIEVIKYISVSTVNLDPTRPGTHEDIVLPSVPKPIRDLAIWEIKQTEELENAQVTHNRNIGPAWRFFWEAPFGNPHVSAHLVALLEASPRYPNFQEKCTILYMQALRLLLHHLKLPYSRLKPDIIQCPMQLSNFVHRYGNVCLWKGDVETGENVGNGQGNMHIYACIAIGSLETWYQMLSFDLSMTNVYFTKTITSKVALAAGWSTFLCKTVASEFLDTCDTIVDFIERLLAGDGQTNLAVKLYGTMVALKAFRDLLHTEFRVEAIYSPCMQKIENLSMEKLFESVHHDKLRRTWEKQVIPDLPKTLFWVSFHRWRSLETCAPFRYPQFQVERDSLEVHVNAALEAICRGIRTAISIDGVSQENADWLKDIYMGISEFLCKFGNSKVECTEAVPVAVSLNPQPESQYEKSKVFTSPSSTEDYMNPPDDIEDPGTEGLRGSTSSRRVSTLTRSIEKDPVDGAIMLRAEDLESIINATIDIESVTTSDETSLQNAKPRILRSLEKIAHGILASHNRSIMGTGGTPVPSVNVDGTSVLKQLHSLLHSSDNAQSPGIEELQRHQSTREVEASDAASYGVQTLHGIQHHVKTPGTLRAADDIESHKRAGASTTGLQVMVKLHGVQKVTEELVTCQKKFNAVSIDNEWSQTSKARADLSNLFVQAINFLNSIIYNEGLNENDREEALSQCREGGLEKLTEERDRVRTEIVEACENVLRNPAAGPTRSN